MKIMSITAGMIIKAIGPTVAKASGKSLWRRLKSLVAYGPNDGIRSVLAAAVDLAVMRAVTEDDSTWGQEQVDTWVDTYQRSFRETIVDSLAQDDAYVQILAASNLAFAHLSSVSTSDAVTSALDEEIDSVSLAAQGLKIWIDEFQFQLPRAIAWAIHREALQRKAHNVEALHDWLVSADSLAALQAIANNEGLSPRIRRQGWLRIADLMQEDLEQYYKGQVGYGMAQALLPDPDHPEAAHQEPEVWVEVQSLRLPRGLDRPSAKERGWAETVYEEASEAAHHTVATKPWRSIVANNRNTVLLGNPGHGKTWLLTRLAIEQIRAFRKHVESFGAIEGLPFPMFSRVDQLVSTNPGGPGQDLLEKVIVATLRTHCTMVTEPDGVYDDLLWDDLERHIDNYGVELFLDALDEAPNGLWNWIRDWQIDHPAPSGAKNLAAIPGVDTSARSLLISAAEIASGRIVISSRLAGYRQPAGVDDSWQTVTLSPLPKKGCVELALQWGVPPAAMEAIRHDLDGNTTMGHVLRVPLLLNMACTLAINGRQWPRSVRDLYASYIDYRVTTAQYWAGTQSGSSLKPYDIGQTEMLLGELALAFCGGGNTRWQDRMPSQEVRQILAKHLELGDIVQDGLDRLLRSGLVVGVSPSNAGQVFYFQHRTIAEYLVAKRVVDTDRWQHFLSFEFWFHRDWDRTLQMIGELVEPDEYVRVIGEQGTDLLGRGTQLAVHCLNAWDEKPDSSSAWVGQRWLHVMAHADEYGSLGRLRELALVRSDWFYGMVDQVLGQQVVAYLALRDDEQVLPLLMRVGEEKPRLEVDAMKAIGAVLDTGIAPVGQRLRAEQWLRSRLATGPHTQDAARILASLSTQVYPTLNALSQYVADHPGSDVTTRSEVWECLWRHETNPVSDRSSLRSWLEAADDGKKLAAINLLGRDPEDPQIVRDLTNLAGVPQSGQDLGSQPDLAQAAIFALAGFGEVAIIREILAQTADGSIASTAAAALAEDRSRSTTKVLLDRLAYFLDDEADSWAALESIMASLGGRDDCDVVQMLRRLTEHAGAGPQHDFDAYVVIPAAIQALVRSAPDEWTRDMLLRVLGTQDEGPVTRAAAQGLVSMAQDSTLLEDVTAWVDACHRDTHLADNSFYDAEVCEELAWATSILSPQDRLDTLTLLDNVWRIMDDDSDTET